MLRMEPPVEPRTAATAPERSFTASGASGRVLLALPPASHDPQSRPKEPRE